MSKSDVWVKRRFLRVFSTALLFVSLGLVVTIAQTFVGSIVGVVEDTSGAVIPEAKVTLVETRTNARRETQSNSSGNYAFPGLPSGTYVVTVAKDGFKEIVSQPILLTPEATARFDGRLQLGDITQRVEVAAESAPILNTENAQLGAEVTRQEIENLPMNSPGSAMNYRYLSSSNQDGGYLAGQRSSFGFYSIDGVSSMAPAWGAWSGPQMGMSLEAVQEITEVTATPSAEFGDVATISLSTRSGTNVFHGSGWWQTNNYALDATGYFTHTKPTGPYKQYFGGTLGGPVQIPHLYDGKNRTFFFFDWEEFLQPGSYESLASVPTQGMRNGDFSALLADDVAIYDPTTGRPFPNNQIPASRISPVSQKFQSTEYMPLPNFGPPGSFVQNFLDTFPNAHPHYYPTGRGDQVLRNGLDTISGRFTYRHQNEDGNSNGLPLFMTVQNRDTTNAYISETHLFSPTVVNEFRFGYSSDSSAYHGTTKGSDILSATGLQLPDASALQGLYGFPQVNFTNFTGYYANADTGWDMNTKELLDNLSITRGKHTLRVGFLMRRYYVNETTSDTSQNFGVLNFTGFGTQSPAGDGGFDYASFLLGIPYSSGTYARGPNAVVNYGTYAAYIQDNWRVTPKLTLNLGLRWEKTTTPVDQHDMRYTFNPANGDLVLPTQKAIDTLVSPAFPSTIPLETAAQAGFPSRSLVSSDNRDFGPRAGFAYLLPHNTVIRGGFGILYTPLLTSAMISSFYGGPFNLQETYQNEMINGVPGFQFPDPFTGSGDFPGVQVGGLRKHIRTPYTEQWNLTLEKQLGNSTVARASYRGHHTLETIYYPDLNQPHVSDNPANESSLVYPNFYNTDLGTNGGSEIGHLFEFQLQRKYESGLTFDFGYTHTKVVTDLRGSDILGYPEYSWDLRRDSGNENGLSRHRFVGSAVWEIPFGTGKRFGSGLPGWARQAFGGWQTSAILVLQSGQFLDPACSNCPDTSYARVFGERPDLIGDPNLSNPTAQRWFNTSAFAIPAYGTLGNSSPGVIVGPGLANVDLGLFKYFQIHERLRFRVEGTAVNAFNHPNLGNPTTDISSINVATITGLTGRGLNASNTTMRSIMLGARLEF